MEALYDYLLKNFEPNKPIFLSDVKTSGINYANIRKQMKNLVDSGKSNGLIVAFIFLRLRLFLSQVLSFLLMMFLNINIF